MRLLALTLALACASPAAAQEVFVEGVGPILSGPLSTSGLVNLSGLTCAPSLVCTPDADSWDCVDGAGASVAVTQGTGTTFETGPFVPGTGATARYGARIDALAEAPRLTTKATTADLWVADFTVITISAPGGALAVSPTFDQGAAALRGFYAYGAASTYVCNVANAAGTPTTKAVSANLASQSGRWFVESCRFDTATKVLTARANGSQSAAAAWNVNPAAATTEEAWFGRHSSTSYWLNGVESLVAIFPCTLTDAELLRIESQWAGTIAESRNVAVDRNSTAGMDYTNAAGVAVADFGDDMGRVLPGTGLYVEEGRTNLLTNASEFDNAAWAKSNNGAGTAAPVVTPNAAVAPDGTTTAEQIAFTAIDAAGEFSVVTMSKAAGAVASNSIYLRTVTGTGTLYLSTTNDAVTYQGRTACALTTSWSRCELEGFATPSSFLVLGPDARDTGQPNTQPALTVYAWRAQKEAGTFATSSINTTTLATARLPDKPTVGTQGFPTGQGEVCVTVTPEWTAPAADAYLFDTRTGTNGVACWVDSSRRANCSTGTAANTTTVQSAALTWTGGAHEVCLRWGAGNVWVEQDHVSVATSLTGAGYMPTAHAASAGIGATVAGAGQFNGWLRTLEVRQ